MNNVRKVVVVSISFAMLLLVLASIPGFAETQDELKQMFVTREEFNKWAYSSGVSFMKYEISVSGSGAGARYVKVSSLAYGGMSDVLASIEEMGALRVQAKCESEMSIRGIRDNNLTSETPTS